LSQFSDFIQMGGHGVFVWSCYGLTLLILGMNIIRPLQLQRRLVQVKRRALAQEGGADAQIPSPLSQVEQ
jgi:heme exporter protein D